MNIASLLQKTAAQFPSATAVIDHDSLYANYGQLARRVQGIAGYLRNELQHVPGDRIALVMKNCPQYIEVLLGTLHAGLAAVPINAKLHPTEFEYILDHSGAKTIFVTSEFSSKFARRGEQGDARTVIDVQGQQYAKTCDATPLPLYPASPDDLAWLFYTSGTTGRPKGAMISHWNLMSMTQAYFESVDRIDQGDTLLHAAPMSHGSGLYIFPNLAKGAQQVVTKSGGFVEEEIFELLRVHNRVSFFAAPTMIHRLVASEFPFESVTDSLKSIIYGGGPMYLADIKAALERFGNKFIQIYGQGESPMTITSLSKRDHQGHAEMALDDLLSSVGSAQRPVEVEIRSPSGESLRIGEIGEVVVRGDPVMLGYWENPAATAETIREGWLYTGDMGTLDEFGYLTLKDRSKDLIISGGSNIYPREVEEVLLQLEGVGEVSVVGKTDLEWGEVVVAFIVRTGEVLTARECDQWCLQRMARFKRPKIYRFVDYLPKNNTGKVLKRELRKLL